MRLMARDVAHGFKGQPLLFDGLNFDLLPGQISALVGPSGSGKSTLLSLLAGTTRPVRGTVELSEIDSVGWIFQNPVGQARRTALDQVALPFLARGATLGSARTSALGLLERFDICDLADRQFRHLSGGEAQRVGFARAVAAQYDAILIDEPTAQLDVRTAQTIGAVIRQLADESRVVVVATHDRRLREQCDKVIDLGELS